MSIIMKAACCFFPTTVIAIDDELGFLNTVSLKISKFSPCKTFRDSKQALDFLKSTQQNASFINRCLIRPEDDYPEHRIIEANVTDIYKEIYNPNRYDEVSVLVVDYAMPGINGAELCKQLRGSRYKIILLTGEAGIDTAVQLFNDGIINRYIRKDEPNYLDKLLQNIYELQYAYFVGLSEIIINSITEKPKASSYLYPSCLDDPIFIDFFEKFIKEHKIIEFYLLDESGSFLLIDDTDKLSWLLVKNKGDMEAAEDSAKIEQMLPETRQAILDRKLLIHFFDQNIKIDDPEGWQSVIYPATKLEGSNSDYYYSYVTKPLLEPELDSDKIATYHVYLEALMNKTY